MLKLSHLDTDALALAQANYLRSLGLQSAAVYPIPRGGVPAAYLIAKHCPICIVEDPADAEVFVDDVIDSGETMSRWCDEYPGHAFVALIDKTDKGSPFHDQWVVFPWEDSGRTEDDSIVGTITNRIKAAGGSFLANDNISDFLNPDELPVLQREVERRVEHLLRGLVIDVDNDHNTSGTAKRIAKMYLNEVYSGRFKPAPKITYFPNAKGLDQMYLTGPITIRSACSHHFVPIIGRCWIGVVPSDRVIGLSKFNRIVEWIASRPQIQEELVMQIADFIEEQIRPEGIAVVIQATHLCMTWRGVKEPMEAAMTTSVMRGVFRSDSAARAEFMALVARG